MNLETIKTKILQDQVWLERALLVLDAKQAWQEEDKKDAVYMAAWVRNQRQKRVPLGKCLTGDKWPGRARFIVQKYCPVLLECALEKALLDAKEYAAKAKAARIQVRKIKAELAKLPTKEAGENG